MFVLCAEISVTLRCRRRQTEHKARIKKRLFLSFLKAAVYFLGAFVQQLNKEFRLKDILQQRCSGKKFSLKPKSDHFPFSLYRFVTCWCFFLRLPVSLLVYNSVDFLSLWVRLCGLNLAEKRADCCDELDGLPKSDPERFVGFSVPERMCEIFILSEIYQ